jgi:hypothetical protein
MGVKLGSQSAGCRVPHLFHTITARRRDERAIPRERDGINRRSCSAQTSDELATRDFPDRSNAIGGTDGKPRSARIEAQATNARPGDRGPATPSRRVKHAHLITARSGEPMPVGAERQPLPVRRRRDACATSTRLPPAPRPPARRTCARRLFTQHGGNAWESNPPCRRSRGAPSVLKTEAGTSPARASRANVDTGQPRAQDLGSSECASKLRGRGPGRWGDGTRIGR